MRAVLLVTCGVAVAAAAPLPAQEAAETGEAVELALSDETAQVRYIDRTRIAGQDDSEIAYAVFLSEERDVVGSAAVLIGTDLKLGNFELQFGPQAYAALLSDENNDVFALALGVTARLDLVRSRGLAIVGSAFVSPDVLTFGSADNLTDFMARAEIELTDRLIGFAGYRWFELDLLMRQELRLQNELFAGVRWELR